MNSKGVGNNTLKQWNSQKKCTKKQKRWKSRGKITTYKPNNGMKTFIQSPFSLALITFVRLIFLSFDCCKNVFNFSPPLRPISHAVNHQSEHENSKSQILSENIFNKAVARARDFKKFNACFSFFFLFLDFVDFHGDVVAVELLALNCSFILFVVKNLF